MNKFRNNCFYSQVYSLRALPQPEQELALERHAISSPGSCGYVALRQKCPLLYIFKGFPYSNNLWKSNTAHHVCWLSNYYHYRSLFFSKTWTKNDLLVDWSGIGETPTGTAWAEDPAGVRYERRGGWGHARGKRAEWSGNQRFTRLY